MTDPVIRVVFIYLLLLSITVLILIFAARFIINMYFKKKYSINVDTKKVRAHSVNLIAHRGLSGIERENTYPAFIAAANRSYYGIETDIHKTADGRFVCIHDEDTERVSLDKTKIKVSEKTAEQLKKISFPDLDGSNNREDIRMPFLEDYIKICKKYGKKCVLELKIPYTVEDIKSIVEEIKKYDYLENLTFISFFIENCIETRRLLPDNDVQWLINGKVTDKVLEILVENKLNLDIYYRSLDKKSIDRLHKYGIKVNCFTCDKISDAKKLMEMGVDYITTNILEAI